MHQRADDDRQRRRPVRPRPRDQQRAHSASPIAVVVVCFVVVVVDTKLAQAAGLQSSSAPPPAMAAAILTYFLLLVVVAHIHLVRPTQYDGASNHLTTYLLKKHDRAAPPDGLIDMRFELDLVHILGIDEIKQTMTVLVYVVEEWVDLSLSWNPEEHDNITKTWLPTTKVWLPDLIVFNMLDHQPLLKNIRSPVEIHNDGVIKRSYPAVYTVTCTITIEDFPLDEQNCSLEIASWAYTEDKLFLNASRKEKMEHYSPNEEWELIHYEYRRAHYEHEGLVVSEILYDVLVRRKPLFYVVTLIIPSYIMCAISIAGLFARFSTNQDRQERFTLGVTAILTMAVLSLVVSEKVPHSSKHVPILVLYFLFNMVVVAIATLMTGPIMRLHCAGLKSGAKPPPHWVFKVLLMGDKNGSINYPKRRESLRLLQRTWSRRSGHDAGWDALNAALTALTQELNKSQELNEQQNTVELWIEVASRLDWVMMIGLLLLLTIPAVFLFVQCLVR
uniref:Uncharacterized protein n=1 Tax=Plectus sambesii TaxID=2011161 RepID=A0A914WSD1_9BILA